jgi:hypothetical protein
MTITAPLVIDVGRMQEDAIEELRRGGGQIAEDVEEVMRLLHASGNPQFGNRSFLPVVVVYSREKNSPEEIDSIAADEIL